MPVSLNGHKYTGAYMNGHRVNGYFNGTKLFNYTVNVNCIFINDKTGNKVGTKMLNISPQVKRATDLPIDIRSLSETSTATTNYHIANDSNNNLSDELIKDGQDLYIDLDFNSVSVIFYVVFKGKYQVNTVYIGQNSNYPLSQLNTQDIMDNKETTLESYQNYDGDQWSNPTLENFDINSFKNDPDDLKGKNAIYIDLQQIS